MAEISELVAADRDTFRTGTLQRHKMTRAQWEQAAGDAARGYVTLLSLWATRSAVHMALMEPNSRGVGILSLENRRAEFPSVARLHPPAQRLERSITDLFGLAPQGAEDTRPWLDHGAWGITTPLAKARPREARQPDYDFLPVIGEGLHQVPVGPVHAGIIEPGHFRFSAQGETVVRLEERLGYTHKGIDRLMQGATVARGAMLAQRCSGDSTVAYGWAYAQATEAAQGVTPPPRALWLRAIMAELERLANHLNDIGAICNDAAFALMPALCSPLREKVMRGCDAAFGHRFMRDAIVPGGVARDLERDGRQALEAVVDEVRRGFEPIVELYDNRPSLLARTVGTGRLRGDLARQFAAGGYIGRASGRDFDLRRDLPYAPYDRLTFKIPVREEGDVDARIWIRIEEVRQSLHMLDQLLGGLPAGDIQAPPGPGNAPGEGLGLVEGFRGDVLVWVALDARGRIRRCHMRDPSWFQWPLLEAVIEDNIIADFPLCNKSFNCSYSGVDL